MPYLITEGAIAEDAALTASPTSEASPSTARVHRVPSVIGGTRIPLGEPLWLGIAAILLTVSSIDAVREIPPLADDYWMIARGPGEIATEYLRDYGWGRFIGMWLLDVINMVRAATGASLVTVMVVVRVATVAAIYVTLRRLYRFSSGVALLCVGLIAWNPPATETWVLLCNLHLAASVIPVLVACGLYARALGELPGGRDERDSEARTGQVPWRVLAAAATAQVVANFIYEQSLLAVPAFVVVLSLVGSRKRLLWRSRMAVVGAAAGVVAVSVVVMVATGYISGRSQGAASQGAQLSDVGAALRAFWVGFGEHHLWRLVEAARTHEVLWWDASPLGLLAVIGTIGASAIIGVRLVSDHQAVIAPPNAGLVVASLAGAYAALLLMGFAYPGFTIGSRLYYIPGAFLAVAVGALAPAQWRVPRVALGLGAAAIMLWLGIVTRRYYEDMRQGTRILRQVARSVARLPASLRQEGVLIIAPSNIGTFSTGVVEPWSLRPAVQALTAVDPEGPLLMVTDCAELAREQPRIVGDEGRPRRWGAVLRYDAGTVRATSTVAAACERR